MTDIETTSQRSSALAYYYAGADHPGQISTVSSWQLDRQRYLAGAIRSAEVPFDA